jgi:hypothetical protein
MPYRAEATSMSEMEIYNQNYGFQETAASLKIEQGGSVEKLKFGNPLKWSREGKEYIVKSATKITAQQALNRSRQKESTLSDSCMIAAKAGRENLIEPKVVRPVRVTAPPGTSE